MRQCPFKIFISQESTCTEGILTVCAINFKVIPSPIFQMMKWKKTVLYLGKYGNSQLEVNCNLILLLTLSVAVTEPVRQVMVGLLWSNIANA